jgi:MGT family glycosyltransferase
VKRFKPDMILGSLFCSALADRLAKEIEVPWCFVNPSFYFGDHATRAWGEDFMGLAAGWFRYVLWPHCKHADLVLHATDREFDPPPADLPGHHHYVGPLNLEPPTRENASFPAPSQGPWALISLSTVPMGGEIAIARSALAALADKPVSTLLTLAPDYPRNELGAIPGNARITGFIPHGRVLKDAALVVSHAGHGIVMKGLHHGVPMVLVPWARDQFGVAWRAERLGVAVVIHREESSEERIAAAVDQVFGDERFSQKAFAISRRLQREVPEDRACHHLEEFLRQQR